MYDYNPFGFQGHYIHLVQKTFKNFDSIKSIKDFMNSLPENDLNKFKILSDEKNVKIPKIYRTGFWGMSKKEKEEYPNGRKRFDYQALEEKLRKEEEEKMANELLNKKH